LKAITSSKKAPGSSAMNGRHGSAYAKTNASIARLAEAVFTDGSLSNQTA